MYKGTVEKRVEQILKKQKYGSVKRKKGYK